MVCKYNHHRPLKVLHVVHSLEVGGLENGVVNLINRLDPNRFEQIILCLTRSGRLATRIKQQGVRILEMGQSDDGFRLPLAKLIKVFRGVAPHLVHTRGWSTVDAVFAARLAGVPRLVHGEHGRDWKDTEGESWKRIQFRRLIGLMVHRYVVVCDFFRRWLQETCRVRNEKIVHIPNGVDTTKFSPLEATPCAQRLPPSAQSLAQSTELRTLRWQLGLPGKGPLVGTVGRLDPVKDFATLLRGFAAVRNHFPEVTLVVVGDGPSRSELTQLANDLGLGLYVHWLRERDDVPSLLRCFDLFVQTSLFEGMSNTILEAMSTGLPIIATQTGGNGELVTGGENGVLIPVGDPQALAKALAGYLENPELRQLHGQQSRERALHRFDLSLMASRYTALYQKEGAAIN